MLNHISACTNERAFFHTRFFPRFSTRVTRHARHSTLREPLHRSTTLSIDWRFSSGRFWRSTFRRRSYQHPFSLYVCPFPDFRRLRHGPRTDVTDSTSVKKANTKPISAPRTTSAPCMHDHCPLPTLILAVDSSNKRPPSLYSLLVSAARTPFCYSVYRTTSYRTSIKLSNLSM